MLYGCRRLRRLGLVVALAAVATFPVAIVAASPAGEAAPRSTATARLTLVVPRASVRLEIARHCRDEARLGYVPVVTVPADTIGVPPNGRFVACGSGDTVYLVPDPG